MILRAVLSPPTIFNIQEKVSREPISSERCLFVNRVGLTKARRTYIAICLWRKDNIYRRISRDQAHHICEKVSPFLFFLYVNLSAIVANETHTVTAVGHVADWQYYRPLFYVSEFIAKCTVWM
jgi:hypothetical protein